MTMQIVAVYDEEPPPLHLLAAYGDVSIVHVAPDKAVELIADLSPDVTVVDATSNLTREALSEILAVSRTMCLFDTPEQLDVIRSASTGASLGLMSRAADPGSLWAGLRRVSGGGSYIGAVAAEFVIARLGVAPRLTSEPVAPPARALIERHQLETIMAREALERQLDEMHVLYERTVAVLASAVELRDEYTGGHIERVSAYALALAGAIDTTLTAKDIRYGYALHDIGKLAVHDSILLKEGRLTDEEFEKVKMHTIEGSRYVDSIPFLTRSKAIIRSHHERWDGQGYPDGLRRDEIPLVARVFSISDTLDAITTDRPYRSAQSLEIATREIGANAGTQFDPEVVRVFLDIVSTDPAFKALRDRGRRR